MSRIDKSFAMLLHRGKAVGQCQTKAPNGTVIWKATSDDCKSRNVHNVTVTRNKKYLEDGDLIYCLPFYTLSWESDNV